MKFIPVWRSGGLLFDRKSQRGRIGLRSRGGLAGRWMRCRVFRLEFWMLAGERVMLEGNWGWRSGCCCWKSNWVGNRDAAVGY